MQLVLNPEGKYQKQIPFPKDFGFFSNLSVDTSITTDIRGTIYIVDGNGSGIVVLGKDGSFVGRQLSMGWNEGLFYYLF